MLFEEKDLFLLRQIHSSALKKEVITTWDLAVKYNWSDEIPKEKKKREDYYRNKTNLFASRLKKMAKNMQIIEIKKDDSNKNVYVLDVDKVKMKRYKMPDGKIRETLAILENNKWTIFQL